MICRICAGNCFGYNPYLVADKVYLTSTLKEQNQLSPFDTTNISNLKRIKKVPKRA